MLIMAASDIKLQSVLIKTRWVEAEYEGDISDKQAESTRRSFKTKALKEEDQYAENIHTKEKKGGKDRRERFGALVKAPQPANIVNVELCFKSDPAASEMTLHKISKKQLKVSFQPATHLPVLTREAQNEIPQTKRDPSAVKMTSQQMLKNRVQFPIKPAMVPLLSQEKQYEEPKPPKTVHMEPRSKNNPIDKITLQKMSKKELKVPAQPTKNDTYLSKRKQNVAKTLKPAKIGQGEPTPKSDSITPQKTYRKTNVRAPVQQSTQATTVSQGKENDHEDQRTTFLQCQPKRADITKKICNCSEMIVIYLTLQFMNFIIAPVRTNAIWRQTPTANQRMAKNKPKYTYDFNPTLGALVVIIFMSANCIGIANGSEIEMSINPQPATFGTTVEINCSSSNQPAGPLSFLVGFKGSKTEEVCFDKKVLIPKFMEKYSCNKEIIGDKQNYTLKIKNFSPEDSANNYRCEFPGFLSKSMLFPLENYSYNYIPKENDISVTVNETEIYVVLKKLYPSTNCTVDIQGEKVPAVTVTTPHNPPFYNQTLETPFENHMYGKILSISCPFGNEMKEILRRELGKNNGYKSSQVERPWFFFQTAILLFVGHFFYVDGLCYLL